MIGIYKITTTNNNKIYIGQSTNVEKRWKYHLKKFSENKHNNPYMQNVFNKYGEKVFKFEIIEECKLEELNDREQYWIECFGGVNSKDNYNVRMGGNGGGLLSEETKKKISATLKGHEFWGPFHYSEEQKKAISERMTGRKISESHRKNISEGIKRYFANLSPEERKRITDKRIEACRKNWNKAT